MSAAEARRGGKPGDLDPPMEVLKANWLREVDETTGEAEIEQMSPETTDASSPIRRRILPPISQADGKAPPTPTTPSTRSMAIDSIVDKVDGS